MKVITLPDNAIAGYLDGRPRDPRVKYVTGMPRGKTYLTQAQRARRKEEALASVAADTAPAAASPTEKPALDSVA